MPVPFRRPGRPRPLSLLGALGIALCLAPHTLPAQWSGPYAQTYLRASHNGVFSQRYQPIDELLNAVDYQRASVYEDLWRAPASSATSAASRDSVQFTRLMRTLERPPRLTIDVPSVAPEFAKLAPDMQSMLAWGRTFRRQLLDALADPTADERSRDSRVMELVANYGTRRDIALSTQPKSADVMDAQLQSLAFRARYPRLNGLQWASRWLELGLYESLLATPPGDARQRQVEAVGARFRRMLERPTETTPYLLPLSPAVAPTFARRYPSAAAIVDNLNMLEDAVADVLVSREIPRSAKRREMDLVRAQFQNDTALVLPVDAWHQRVAAIGANNMGGETVGFGTAFPTPTVTRGASMATQMPAEHQHGAMTAESMPGMQHGDMPQGQATLEQMMEIYNRMMADPVIRERAASDPTLQRLLTDAKLAPGGMPGMPGMPGMQHDMPGMRPDSTHAMSMTPATAAAMMSGTPEERKRAIEFIVRLLSDPAVEARIHSYPELHVLWSDPEVQRRLTDLKKTTPRPPGGSPPPSSR